MATAGTTSVKSIKVALKAGVNQATLPNNVSMVPGKDYAISLEDYAKITNAARTTILDSTPETKEYVIPWSDNTHYTLDLTTINGLADIDTLNQDAKAAKAFKVGDVVQGFNGTAFKLVLVHAGSNNLVQGDAVVWNGSAVTSDTSDVASGHTFAGVSIGSANATTLAWIQISGEAVSVKAETNVAAGDSVAVSENTDGTVTSSTNEVQAIDLGDIGAGDTFTLTYATDPSSAIAYDTISAANVLAGLNSIAALNGNVSVVEDTPGTDYSITFINDLAATNVSLITITDPTTFTPGNSGNATVTTVGSGGLTGGIGTATSYDTGRADIDLRATTSVNRHNKTRDLFFWK